MRMVFGLVLLLGIGLAGFAVYMAQGYISTYQQQLDRERAARAAIVPTVDVVVLNRALRYGDKLTKEDVRTVKWPQNAIPEGTFASIEALYPEGENDLRSVVRAMEKDEAVLAVKVTKPGEDAGVSSRLAVGMRAFALRVDVASGVSGFLSPGDRVDVYWTGRAEMSDGESQEITQLIEQSIRLLAIDQSVDAERDGPTVARTVTVEATPQQVAALAQAQATGSLSLALVGTFDDGSVEGVAMNQSELLGIERTQVVEREAERVCSVRTRRGAEVVEIPIPCTN
jgi:pilus assembly protein CpaB